MVAAELSPRFMPPTGDGLVERETVLNRAIESLAEAAQEARRPLRELRHRLETLSAARVGGTGNAPLNRTSPDSWRKPKRGMRPWRA